MPSSRSKLLLVSSIFGIGCLLCTVAALAFLRKRRQLKDEKDGKDKSKREIILDVISRRRKLKSSSRNIAESSKSTINDNTNNESQNQLLQSQSSDVSVDCNEEVYRDADLQTVMHELKCAIDNLESHLSLEVIGKDVTPSSSRNSSDINIQTELQRLQELLTTISTGEIEIHKEEDIFDGAGNLRCYDVINGDDDDDSDDSFVSATESIELENETVALENELIIELNLLIIKNKGKFYNSALQFMRESDVPIRTYRTSLLRCENDLDFCAKTYCLRLAFQMAFTEEGNQNFFKDAGRKLLIALLLKAKKDPKSFLNALDAMIEFCSEKDNWIGIEEELSTRGVCCMSFFDIVLDFVIMDSLDDLTEPPYAVITAIQNRWLSQGIKESALTTALWSILTAKSRLLKNQNGFLTRMYSISKQISPVLAWGLLGPVEDLKLMCNTFKDGLLGYLQDIFNSNTVSYESPQQLSIDIMKIARQREKALCELLLT